MTGKSVNLACGDIYLEEWINLDFHPNSPDVMRCDLLGPLPLCDGEACVVYSSHFLEHVPRDMVSDVLAECFRIMSVGGRIRLVLPDWEELCVAYLEARRSGHHERADFVLLEMLDQCVRTTAGGRLARFYDDLRRNPDRSALIDFVKYRTGRDVLCETHARRVRSWTRLLNNPRTILALVRNLYTRVVVRALPSTFRTQNVSLTRVGERHAWMYDLHSIKELLIAAGFEDVRRMAADSSNIEKFPLFPLDILKDGSPRKGAESMYIEAVKS